jgi:hypothetical protein
MATSEERRAELVGARSPQIVVARVWLVRVDPQRAGDENIAAMTRR